VFYQKLFFNRFSNIKEEVSNFILKETLKFVEEWMVCTKPEVQDLGMIDSWYEYCYSGNIFAMNLKPDVCILA